MQAIEKQEQLSAAFEAQALETQQALAELLETSLEERLSKLDVVERARLLTTVAYAINSLSFVFLKVQGVPPKSHPVKKELV
eukprot:jgi/Hompol1/5327/HPOL_004358-RA